MHFGQVLRNLGFAMYLNLILGAWPVQVLHTLGFSTMYLYLILAVGDNGKLRRTQLYNFLAPTPTALNIFNAVTDSA